MCVEALARRIESFRELDLAFIKRVCGQRISKQSCLCVRCWLHMLCTVCCACGDGLSSSPTTLGYKTIHNGVTCRSTFVIERSAQYVCVK